MRSAKVGSTKSSNQARRMAPCLASRRSISRVPNSISRIQTAERNMDSIETLFAQAATWRSALPMLALRNSEMTLVSRRHIMTSRPAWETHPPFEDTQIRSQRLQASPTGREYRSEEHTSELQSRQYLV